MTIYIWKLNIVVKKSKRYSRSVDAAMPPACPPQACSPGLVSVLRRQYLLGCKYMAVAESPPGLVHRFQVQGKFVLRVSQVSLVSHPPPCKCHLCPPSCRVISVAERRESLHIGLESKGV